MKWVIRENNVVGKSDFLKQRHGFSIFSNEYQIKMLDRIIKWYAVVGYRESDRELKDIFYGNFIIKRT